MKQATLGAHIRAARLKAGLTVRALAELVNISHGYLVKLENDQVDKPAGDVLQRIGDALGLDSSELLAYIGIKPSSVLPQPRDYFLRKLGASEEEADMLANVVQYLRKKNEKEKPSEDTKRARHEGPD